ncbi:MAG: hypothetical protein KO206_08615 [Methanomicrobiaceae archaeon]|uniref:Uncharacterized protein n=1 Tax=hydrocarbon metagenome TaxID=938273 RepID=A0A0W8FEE7_9ZZZZ|nr:hypothetical protein [Methanomicrobiaceae archaeon]MDD5419884.1 hypothetical protein [Methanomicrobiaceae archaeon]
MKPDVSSAGAVLASLCIIAGGVLIGTWIFYGPLPHSRFILPVLAVLVVLGAGAIIHASWRGERGTAEK